MSMANGGSGATSAGGSSATGGTTGGSCTGAGPAKDGTCKATANGVYAMKVELDVWYMDEINDPGIFDAYRTKLNVYFKNTITDICPDGSNGNALAHPCGTDVPGLYAGAIMGVIQIVFPGPDVWDKFPDYKTTGHTTGFNPGDTLTIDQSTGLLGISLPMVDSTWPTYMETPTFKCPEGMGDACFVDVDMDGKPGITISFKSGSDAPPSPGYGSGWKFVPAPTSLVAAVSGSGASQAYVGIRQKVGGSGMIGADCKSGMGAAESDDVESRVQGCVNTDGSACSPSDANFVDQNTPAFHVLKMGEMPPAKWMTAADASVDTTASMGAKSTVVRLGDATQAFKCSDVIAAFPK